MDLRDRHDTVGPSPDAQALCVRLLGEFSVSCNLRHVDASSWRFRNAKRLVQILALTPGHRIHREQVTDWFWPDTNGRSANNNFHQVLHHARRALKSIGLDGHVLRLERDVLSFQAPAGTLWIDVEAFECAAHDAQCHKDPERYLTALGLYSGGLLPEERYADWAAVRRDALDRTYIGLLLQLGEIHEARGDLAHAERTYSQLIIDDPLNESGHAGLMRVYALTGRRHQSFAQYRQLEAVTRRELDVDPSPEILKLRDDIGQGVYVDQEAASEDARPVASSSETAFVGRERELHILREAIEQSFSGRGHVLMLSGEPGVGKTRIAREATAYARRGGSTVLWGNCYQGDGAPAYWPWVQIIREAIGAVDTETLRHPLGREAADIGQIVPEIGDRLPEMTTPRNLGAEQARFQLFDSITRFFKRLSLRTPLWIVLDDLHWSDRSTLLLLSFLGREVDHRRMVILGTYRDTEAGRDHPLAPTLAELSRGPALQRISLSGLSESDVRQLIESYPGQAFPDVSATLVFQRTEGNPFFVGEVLRMMLEEHARGTALQEWTTTVPQGVRDVISQRLSRLSAKCAEVLAGAGVIGREFNLSILELTVERDRMQILDALDEALHAQLIEDVAANERQYRFTHALVQETVYNGLTSARNVELHRRAAKALEKLHAGELDHHLTALAYHYARAAVGGELGPAISYGMRAGDQALARIAYSEAMNHYQRTLDVIESCDPSARTDLVAVLLRLGDAHNHVGNRAEARTTFLRAANVSRELRLPTQFARATLGYAGLGIFTVGEDHVTLLEEAVGWLPEEDTVVRARILARLAFELTTVASIDRRSALSHYAEGIARRTGDPSTLIFVLITKNWTVKTLDNLDTRLATSEEVLNLVAESGEVLLAPTAHAMRFYDGLETGDIELCERQIAIFDDLADRYREPQRKWLALIFKAECAVIEGRFIEAEEVIESARAIAHNVMPAMVHDRRAISLMVAIRREQGRLGEVDHMLEVVVDSYPGNPYWPAMRSYVRSELAYGNGVEHDVEELLTAIERVDRLDGDSLAAAALLSMTEHVTGDSTLARRLYDVVEPYCGHYIFAANAHHWHGPVSYYAGRLATAIGWGDVAEQHFSQAITMSARMRARPFLAHSQYELASILHLRGEPGDSDRSAQLLSEAYDTAIGIGMPALADKIRDKQNTLHLAGATSDERGIDAVRPASD